MITIHTIRAHAQEVYDKSTKIKGSCQSGRKVEAHHSKNDLPLANLMMTYEDGCLRYFI